MHPHDHMSDRSFFDLYPWEVLRSFFGEALAGDIDFKGLCATDATTWSCHILQKYPGRMVLENLLHYFACQIIIRLHWSEYEAYRFAFPLQCFTPGIPLAKYLSCKECCQYLMSATIILTLISMCISSFPVRNNLTALVDPNRVKVCWLVAAGEMLRYKIGNLLQKERVGCKLTKYIIWDFCLAPYSPWHQMWHMHLRQLINERRNAAVHQELLTWSLLWHYCLSWLEFLE